MGAITHGINMRRIRLLPILVTIMFNIFSHSSAADKTCPQTYTYVLQADQLAKSRQQVVNILRDCGRDIIILDAFYSVGKDGRWSREEIETIRSGKKCRKVVSYFSIGEAEDYRSYWHKDWSKKKPDFLLEENPDWKGNFKVKYWSAQWQEIMLDYMQGIISSGFDGVMLDIVDGFEYFENVNDSYIDNRINEQTTNTYRQDMRNFIQLIASTGRKTNPGFLVIPQNGSQLLSDPRYCKTVSGQALESLFTLPKKRQTQAHTRYILQQLQPLIKQNKPVFCTEYAKTDKLKNYAMTKTEKYGFLLLLAKKALNTIGQSGKE